MTLTKLLKQAEKIVTDNSPAILTALGVTGTITTAYLTGKATFKAADIIKAEQFKINVSKEAKPRPMEIREKFDLTWKLYLPAVGSGVLTIGSIIAANRVGTRRAAAMAAAYSISEKAFSEYKDKVVEKIGANKEQAIRDEVAQDRVNRTPGGERILVTDGSKVMCHDAFSNQFFMSDMETLRKAQNDINAQIIHSDYATITDFYNFIDSDGLQPTSVSSEMGWNTDKMLEIDFTTVMWKEKTPCISINFAVVPTREPWQFR